MKTAALYYYQCIYILLQKTALIAEEATADEYIKARIKYRETNSKLKDAFNTMKIHLC